MKTQESKSALTLLRIRYLSDSKAASHQADVGFTKSGSQFPLLSYYIVPKLMLQILVPSRLMNLRPLERLGSCRLDRDMRVLREQSSIMVTQGPKDTIKTMDDHHESQSSHSFRITIKGMVHSIVWFHRATTMYHTLSIADIHQFPSPWKLRLPSPSD